MNRRSITHFLTSSLFLVALGAWSAGCVDEPMSAEDIVDDESTAQAEAEQALFSTAQQIRSGVGANFCLDVSPLQNGKLYENAPVVINNCISGTTPQALAQTWTVSPDGYVRNGLDATYCLDGGTSTANETKMRIAMCNGSNGQRFSLSPTGELRSLYSPGACLDVFYGLAVPGQTVQFFQCNGYKHQRWFSTPKLPVSASQYLDIKITGVSLNGQGNSLVGVAPGAMIQAKINYTIKQNPACPSCVDQIMVGWANPGTFQGCAYSGIPSTLGTSGTGTVYIGAPTTPGVYYLRFNESLQYSCTSAAWTGVYMPEEERNIAVIVVN